jgi:hypothetical protein
MNRELSKEELQELDFDTLQSLQHEIYGTGSAEYNDLVTKAVLEMWILRAIGNNSN